MFTPAGNWSSFPPHKHDTERPGESVLEEIYYFEVADGPSGPGLAYQRVYGTPERPADVLAEVRSGDVVIIPHGWHGPSMAVPGYDLYYLNVMAGPGLRDWLICDDPAHSWVREQWEDQPVDPPGDHVENRMTTVRLTVGQAVVRFLAAQRSERDGTQHRLIEGCFGIFGHGNVAGLGQGLLEAELEADLTPRARRCSTCRDAMSRPWCTPPRRSPGPGTGCRRWPARRRSGPARRTW